MTPIPLLPDISADRLHITTEDVKVVVQGKAVPGKADVALFFSPDLRARVMVGDLPRNPDLLSLAHIGSVQIEFSSGQERSEMLITDATLGTENSIEATPKQGAVFTGKNTTVPRVEFFLANFVEFDSDTAQTWQGKRYQTIKLEADDWEILIYQPPDIRDRIKYIRRTGGFILTHSGTIERINKKLISSRKVENLQNGLGYFFSFLRGFRCFPTVLHGITRKGNETWKKWGNPLVDHYQAMPSWFNPFLHQAIPAAFRGFWQKWNDKLWGPALRAVIYWYCHSNRAQGGVDGAIILAQTALERLAWAFLVESKGLSSDGFKKLDAHDKIRLLAAQCGIPLEVPETLSSLQKVARKFGLDGPGVVTEARNSIVHPAHKRASDYSDTIPEAWLLSLWYIELILLFLFGYSGEYRDRLGGQIRRVPWAT
jgi:hypothetical protein